MSQARHGIVEDEAEHIPPPEQRHPRDLSPEARRREALHTRVRRRIGPGTRFFQVVKRVLAGAYNDGLIHAGNLAYLSLIAIFPFFVTATAIFNAFGEVEDRAAAVATILVTLPPQAANAVGPVALDVIDARSGWLLWAGALVGLWTVGSLIETIRDILRRAYGTEPTVAFWRYRLFTTGIIVAAVLLILLSLFVQVMIGALQQFIGAYLPGLEDLLANLAWSRFVPAFVLFGALYMLFYALTPSAYRSREYPKWPGALFVTLWWMLVTFALPAVIRQFFSYDLTYGSLAGVMIVLFFFWLVGLGVVIGAELNAALAETPEEKGGEPGMDEDGERAGEERESEQDKSEEGDRT
ncbi:MAG: ribonuclease BN [Sphingomonadales bacterium CG12_big_fil_rev_8_21_14_0_65_65_10]|uniref:Uncharacterized protein n=1 Tax=Blastomonas marina TaxID=1867408 RepID=A0ABQ1FI86_9SPHN|nr:YihY/virulence factor BrkB family protein [Blastomonas marina]PIW54471.1 MAG: ribonuclease BN [Sphingomonadales bacterium CG12_big_fil_rev_8_21_14_0_65_65_10]WPZ03413.1 YihY/virulence factor BrkB family protein [Blastomonas marina]GGA11802.1 hypothetical protein GCM10010923_23070 [Blastomonas marina]